MRETPTTLLAPAANEAINHNNSTTTTTTTTKKKKKSKSEQEEEEAHQQEGEEGEGEEVHPQPPPFPFVVGRSRSQAATRRVTPTTGAMSGTGTLTPTASSSSSSSATVEKLLPNGDLFKGSFSSNVPHGTGKYLWTDGCMYQGDWRRGKAWGKGKFSWPSGATYEGEFKSGRMDGFGTFTGSDGDTYRGSWSTDRKHGYGQKSYANGDFYQGLWKRNVQEGQGRYVWRNGNEYVGEWKNGFINGRGVLIWCNGNRYDGQWENGVPKGSGVFTWPDGSCYVGSWNNNNKYVINKNQQQLDGTFYPPMPPHPLPRMRTPPLVVQQDSLLFTRKRSSTSSLDAAAAGASARGSLTERNFPRICIWESDGEAGDITCDIIDNVEASMFYRDGTDYDPLRAVGGGAVGSAPRPSPCCFAREAKKTGQTISKGHKNYDLMLNLQLGIRYSVGKHASNHRELRPVDFDPREKFWTRFPSEGSKVTPPHQSAEFRWKDYCPMVFRHLRDFFGIDPADYMLAICGNDALRELSSPGKSGSFFYLTQDDRFMIKTVKKSEVKVLLRMLPSYYQHVSQYENSLVTKFFGVHCVKPVGGQKTRFIVMGNLFCSEYRIHKRFDLKGSSHGRSTHKPDGEIDETTTLKDLDLNFVFRLQRSWFQELIRQIELDCEFLEAERIMDYSLLIGLHFRDDYSDENIGLSPQVDSGKKDLRVKKGYQFLEVQLQDMNQILAGWKPVIRLGANMPARAEQVSRSELELYTDPTGGGEIFDVILYFGIIDILQDYDISKKLEHAYKSLQVDPTLISAVDPKLYSKRFRDFTGRIFVEDD